MRTSIFAVAAAVVIVCLLALTPQRGRELAVAVDPLTLFDQPFDSALAMLGPPVSGYGVSETIRWMWRDEGRGFLYLVTYRDRVVHVDTERGKGDVVATAVPETGHYMGQPLSELLARLGRPDKAHAQPITVVPQRPGGPIGMQSARPAPYADLQLHFGELGLCVSGGRVIGTASVPLPIHGPR